MSDKVRIHLDIDRELHARAQKAIPWGMRRLILETILERVVAGIEKEGQIMLGAIVSGEYEMRYVKRVKDIEEILQKREDV